MSFKDLLFLDMNIVVIRDEKRLLEKYNTCYYKLNTNDTTRTHEISTIERYDLNLSCMSRKCGLKV